MVATAATTTVGGCGVGDFICLGVILRSYAFILGGRKWNFAPAAINDACLHLGKEDLPLKGLKRMEK